MGQIHKNLLSNLKFLELKGGGRKVKWAEVIKNNAWYINEHFLLPNIPLSNPDWFSGGDLKAYWRHWYKLAESGQHFTFKRVGDYLPEKDNSGGEEGMEEGEGGGEQQPGTVMTPRQYGSDEERIAFLYSLLPQCEHKYHSIITILASMEVGKYILWSPHTPALT